MDLRPRQQRVVLSIGRGIGKCDTGTFTLEGGPSKDKRDIPSRDIRVSDGGNEILALRLKAEWLVRSPNFKVETGSAPFLPPTPQHTNPVHPHTCLDDVTDWPPAG